MVTNRVHHDRTFWGIRFPIGASSFDQSVIHVVEEDLKTGGHSVLQTRLQGLDLAVILPSVVSKADRKFIEHTKEFG